MWARNVLQGLRKEEEQRIACSFAPGLKISFAYQQKAKS